MKKQLTPPWKTEIYIGNGIVANPINIEKMKEAKIKEEEEEEEDNMEWDFNSTSSPIHY
mgnify:CR=1 FL=1